MAFTPAQSAYLADLLTGLGSGLMSAPRNGPPLAGFSSGISNANQLMAMRRQQADQDQERQFRANQMRRQEQADADAAAQRKRAESGLSGLLGQSNQTPKFVGGAGSGPSNFQAPAPSAPPPAWATPEMRAIIQSMDPEQGLAFAAKLATEKPDAPSLTEFYTPDGRAYKGYLDPRTQQPVQVGEAYARWQPPQPKGPSELQQRAVDAGLKPGTIEYRNFMLTGGGKPEAPSDLQRRAADAGLTPGTPEFQQFMMTGGKVPEGPGGAFGGTGLDAQDSNILIRGQTDPEYRKTPEYQLAYWRQFQQPKPITTQDPNDPTRQIMQTMTVPPPAIFANPGATNQPPTPPTGQPGDGGASLAAPPAPAQVAPTLTPVPGSETRKPAPPGYAYDDAGNLSYIPGGPADPNVATPEQRNEVNKKLTGLDRLQAALDNYKNLVSPKDPGTDPKAKPGQPGAVPVKPGIGGSVLGLPTDAASTLGSAYTALAIEAKNLYELGALSGPDYGLIQQTLQDPNTTRGYLQGDGGRLSQIGEVQKVLDNARSALDKNYSPAMRTTPQPASIDALKNKYGITPVNPAPAAP